jgi:hypothetical protein
MWKKVLLLACGVLIAVGLVAGLLAPVSDTDSRTAGATQSARLSGPDQADMEKVVARAAIILGVSESDLSNAFHQAAGVWPGGTPQPTEDNPYRWRPPQTAQGQPPVSFSSDMMKSIYSKIAATLNLNADNVAAAFEQAQSELEQ